MHLFLKTNDNSHSCARVTQIYTQLLIFSSALGQNVFKVISAKLSENHNTSRSREFPIFFFFINIKRLSPLHSNPFLPISYTSLFTVFPPLLPLPAFRMSSMQAQSTAEAPSKESHFRGVRKKSSNRFFAEIRDPSKKRRMWLGTYSSDIEAAHAYDLAARAIKGFKAKTNFPLSAFQNPNPIQRRATHKNPKPREENVVVPSWINSNMVARAAFRPHTHDYISKSFTVGMGFSSSPSPSQFMFPPAAVKMSNQPRRDESNGGMGVINGGSKESHNPSNSSDPSSSAVTECSDGGINLMAGIDLNLPAPDIEGVEHGHPCKTLWLLK